MKRYSLNTTKYLLEPEAKRLEETFKHFHQNTRDVLLLELSLRTGARAQEILNIERSHLNCTDRTILIYGLKGSADREIPLRRELFERLDNYSKDISGRIFPISYNTLRGIWTQYRPVKKKLHSLRHTFAIRLFKKTKDLRLVQLSLGHRNIANTMVYAEYIYSKTELKRLIL